MVLSVATLGLLALAFRSLEIKEVAFGITALGLGVVAGLSAYTRAGLGALARRAHSGDPPPELRERGLPLWCMPAVRAAPLVWASGGLGVLAAGFINAAHEGDRAVTVLAFPAGGTLGSAATSYVLLLYLVQKRKSS